VRATCSSFRPSALAFVSLKAFGDLVVLRTMLRRVRGTAPAVVIGSHLVELFRALGDYPGECALIESGTDVPAMFDLRRRGLRSGLRSAASLRRRLQHASIPLGATLVFDRIGWRERFIAGRRATAALPAAANIYTAYNGTGLFEKDSIGSLIAPNKSKVSSVGIFPASRIARKDVPRALVSDVADAAIECGLQPMVYVLEGERPDLEGLAQPLQRLPRTFAALVAAVRSVDLVISADSLPAHLAENSGVPVFVVTPTENRYWLPLTAYERNLWARFDQAATCSHLREFLTHGGAVVA